MNKDVIDKIRENEKLQDEMSDEEIAREYKYTYTAARAAVNRAQKLPDQMLADAMRKVLPFMRKKK